MDYLSTLWYVVNLRDSMGNYYNEVVIIMASKKEALDLIKQLKVPDTPEYDEIVMFYHCEFCLKNNSPSGRMEVGTSKSVSRIIIQCGNCKKTVKIINLAQTQADAIKHLFKIKWK